MPQPVLADTSAWVELDRDTGSGPAERLDALTAADGPLAYTEPVLMEVLAGARDDRREADLRRRVVRHLLLPFDPAGDFDAAARIYRRCRQAGVTPRGLLDCAIAAVAWRTGAAVLASDVDLIRICSVMSIDLDPASTPL